VPADIAAFHMILLLRKVSADQGHVGVAICAADMTLQQMKKMTHTKSLGQLKFKLNWEHLKFITDQQKLLGIRVIMILSTRYPLQ
jgi:hypothetical protein